MGLHRFTTIPRARWVDAILETLTALVLAAGASLMFTLFLERYPLANGYVVLGVGLALFLLTWSLVYKARERLKEPGTFRGECFIGEDGVRLDSPRTRHFFAFGEMREVSVNHQKLTVEIGLTNGETVDFRVTNPAEVREAIEAGRERARARSRSAPIRALERGEAEVVDWAKRALEMREVGLREEAITPERLAEVAEDHGAEPEQRIAAALALRAAPEPLRVRVRVAAESTARPYVAEAMTHAVDGEVEVPLLERALNRPPH